MNWSFDISSAPRDSDIWLATKCGKVIKSYWIDRFGPGHWAGLGTKEQPVAWQVFVVPDHPNAVSDLGLNIVTKHSEIQANPEETGVHGEAESVPVVDAGSRPAIGRSMAATSERMDATGGESAATNPQAETSRQTSPVVETDSDRSGAGASKVVCPALIDDVGGQ